MRIRGSSKRDRAILERAQAAGINATHSSTQADLYWVYEGKTTKTGFLSYKELQNLIKQYSD